MQRWQYYTEPNDQGDNQRQLNRAGREGWELVAVDEEYLYFKRPNGRVITAKMKAEEKRMWKEAEEASLNDKS